MNLNPIKESYVNISGNVYDSDYINLAIIDNNKINFGKNTLFLNEEEKSILNSQPIENNNNAVYIIKYMNSYGVIANLDIEEYNSNKIKCHELVLPDIVQGMISNYHFYNAETAPVCVVHSKKINLKDILDKNNFVKKYIYKDVELYLYQDEKAKEIIDNYKNIEEMYVADGHHRLYSTSMLGRKKDVLCCFYSLDEVEILPIHRVLNSISKKDFERAKNFISESFEVVENINTLSQGYVRLTKGEEILTIKLKDVEGDSFWNNDVYRLNTQIITTVFRIFDNSRIKYILGNDIEVYKKKLDNEDILFELSALEKEVFIELSGKNSILPPKTTCFTPKFPSFLIFKKYR